MIHFGVGNLANISDERLYAPIKNVRLADKEYIEWAKEFAREIVKFDPTGKKTNIVLFILIWQRNLRKFERRQQMIGIF